MTYCRHAYHECMTVSASSSYVSMAVCMIVVVQRPTKAHGSKRPSFLSITDSSRLNLINIDGSLHIHLCLCMLMAAVLEDHKSFHS